MHLPSPEMAADFLQQLPANAHILDFGAGTGAWSAAFLRDRPDVFIDVLDQNIAHAKALPDDFKGKKLALRFQDFRAPDTPYDAIWARSVLFFMPAAELAPCFHQLSRSLHTHGLLAFTMVDDSPDTTLAKFYGMAEPRLMEMLDKEGFNLVKLTRSTPPYGATKTPLLTFNIYARKR